MVIILLLKWSAFEKLEELTQAGHDLSGKNILRFMQKPFHGCI